MSCPVKNQLGQESQQAKGKGAKQKTQHTANQMLGSIVGLGRKQLTISPVQQQIGQESQQAKETKANQRRLHMANMMPMLVGQFLATKPFFPSSRQWETAGSRRLQQFFFPQRENSGPRGIQMTMKLKWQCDGVALFLSLNTSR